MRFDWDPAKEQANLDKYGISFGEAIKLFSSGVDYLEVYDEDHSQDEDRFIAIGPVIGRIVLVAYTERPEGTTRVITRVISARPATRRETQLYREHKR